MMLSCLIKITIGAPSHCSSGSKFGQPFTASTYRTFTAHETLLHFLRRKSKMWKVERKKGERGRGLILLGFGSLL